MSVPVFGGLPREIGAARREAWGFEPQALPPPDLARVATLRTMLERIAPHWLEEAGAFAPGEAGLNALLHFQCREPRPDPASLADANCSTLLALGAGTKDGKPLLLKIRDEAPVPQVMFRQKSPGCHAFLGGTNIGNLGLAQMANEKGLVGGNNTGGPLKDRSTAVGLNDCLILRLIAERCATCGEAIALLEELATGGLLGNGGYARGMIFLLADATGEGAIAECTRHEVFSRRWREGIHGRTNHFVFAELEPYADATREGEVAMLSSRERYARMGELACPPLDAKALMAISRDTSGCYPLCQEESLFPWRTVSAWVHRVEAGRLVSFACNTVPTLGSFSVLKSKPFV